MKITKITHKFGTTINTGDFESVRIDWEMSAELEAGDTVESVAEALRTQVRAQVASQAKKVIAKREQN